MVDLICRKPLKKWKFRVWQFMEIKQHVASCFECRNKLDEMSAKNPQPPQIGPTPEVN